MARPSAGRATRIATTGVATASCLGLVAAMGAADEPADVVVTPMEAPAPAAPDVTAPVARKVVVVVRRHRAAAPVAPPAATSAAPALPRPAPPPTPATPALPAPQARSGGS